MMAGSIFCRGLGFFAPWYNTESLYYHPEGFPRKARFWIFVVIFRECDKGNRIDFHDRLTQ